MLRSVASGRLLQPASSDEASGVFPSEMNIVLISTYELGRQPFGLASPAAWLRDGGHTVTQFDLSRQKLDEAAISAAQLIAFYLPMHTATRLALPVIAKVRALNPAAKLCAYGLYAPLNADFLRAAGVTTILGGEFEGGLLGMANAGQKKEPASARKP